MNREITYVNLFTSTETAAHRCGHQCLITVPFFGDVFISFSAAFTRRSDECNHPSYFSVSACRTLIFYCFAQCLLANHGWMHCSH